MLKSHPPRPARVATPNTAWKDLITLRADEGPSGESAAFKKALEDVDAVALVEQGIAFHTQFLQESQDSIGVCLIKERARMHGRRNCSIRNHVFGW